MATKPTDTPESCRMISTAEGKSRGCAESLRALLKLSDLPVVQRRVPPWTVEQEARMKIDYVHQSMLFGSLRTLSESAGVGHSDYGTRLGPRGRAPQRT